MHAIHHPGWPAGCQQVFRPQLSPSPFPCPCPWPGLSPDPSGVTVASLLAGLPRPGDCADDVDDGTLAGCGSDMNPVALASARPASPASTMEASARINRRRSRTAPGGCSYLMVGEGPAGALGEGYGPPPVPAPAPSRSRLAQSAT